MTSRANIAHVKFSQQGGATARQRHHICSGTIIFSGEERRYVHMDASLIHSIHQSYAFVRARVGYVGMVGLCGSVGDIFPSECLYSKVHICRSCALQGLVFR